MLSVNDCSWWVFAVIDVCSLCSMSHVHMLELCNWSSIPVANLCCNQFCGIKGLLLIRCFLVKKKLSFTGQSLITSHLCYSIPSILALGANDPDPGIGSPFWQSRLLTMTLWPFSLLLNVQVVILVGSSGFFNFAFMSVDGCCLYIIIHFGMLWWDCRKGWCLGVAGLIQNLNH